MKIQKDLVTYIGIGGAKILCERGTHGLNRKGITRFQVVDLEKLKAPGTMHFCIQDGSKSGVLYS